MRTSLRIFVSLLALSAAAACGDETTGDGDGAADAGPSADARPLAERYLPLAPGRTWTWQVTPAGGGALYDKVQTIGALEDVGGAKAGTVAFRVETLGDDTRTVSWQEDTGEQIRRHREQTYVLGAGGALLSDQVFVAYKLRLDDSPARLVVGETYTETYTEAETDPATGAITTRSKVEVWTVEAVDEMVTVPAGSFSCLRVKRMGDDEGDSMKTYWFAKGVGKVKEVGKATEELKSFAE